MISRDSPLRPSLWLRSGSSAARRKRSRHRRPQLRRQPSARPPRTTLPPPLRSPSGAPRPVVRSSRPALAGYSALRTSATSSPARPPSTWASSMSPSTMRRLRSTGGYQPYAATPAAPAGTSPEAAIATAAYDTLTGLQPQLAASQAILDGDYAAYLAAIPDGTSKTDGIAVGDQAAQAVLALRASDGRGCTTTLTDLGLTCGRRCPGTGEIPSCWPRPMSPTRS